MKICIYGAGAIGGFLGAYLTRAGHEVVMIARGEKATALQASGLSLRHGDVSFTTHPAVARDPAEVGAVEAVIVAVKGPALPEIAARIAPLLGPDTPVLFAMNGIPWWYDYGRPDLSTPAAALLDPTGCLEGAISSARAIGCVIDCPVHLAAPNAVVANNPAPGHFTVGEPDGSISTRVQALSHALEGAGMKGPVSPDIRHVIWAKLVINLSRSPLSVFTGTSEMVLAGDPQVTEIAREMIVEAAAVAASHGIALDPDWDFLLAQAHRVEHKPSMLQDWEAGRAMEIDSIVAIVSRFGVAASIETPTIDRILALLQMKARAAGLY